MESHKREHPRGPLQARVRYFEWNEPHDAVATEIGGGGIFVETATPIAEGSLLTLRVSLPLGHHFTVLGRVVRTVRGSWARLRRSGMGIEFVDLAAGDRHAVLDYLARNALRSA